MRVIAGVARRLQLETPSEGVRPTTDRTKETLFNMIQNDVYQKQVLDLFAGSGALGIEALSRGAAYCTFNDISHQGIEIIKKNLNRTKLVEKAEIIKYDYVSALNKLSQQERQYDLIFLDPPYKQGFVIEALKQIDGLGLLSQDGYVIVESERELIFNTVALHTIDVCREKTYRTNKFTFFKHVR